MKSIIIKGDFTIEGDVKGLGTIKKKYKFAEIMLNQEPCFCLDQFSCCDIESTKQEPKCRDCNDTGKVLLYAPTYEDDDNHIEEECHLCKNNTNSTKEETQGGKE